jgi:PIN domain nuclease of toxin-antitoxin system
MIPVLPAFRTGYYVLINTKTFLKVALLASCALASNNKKKVTGTEVIEVALSDHVPGRVALQEVLSKIELSFSNVRLQGRKVIQLSTR